MNLRITSKAKNKQISFLLALDNLLTKRKHTKTSLAISYLKQFLANKNTGYNFRIKEGTRHNIEVYADKNLIAYYA